MNALVRANILFFEYLYYLLISNYVFLQIAMPPRKRAAIVLDKLMYALQKALDEPGSENAVRGSRQVMHGPVSYTVLSYRVFRKGYPISYNFIKQHK